MCVCVCECHLAEIAAIDAAWCKLRRGRGHNLEAFEDARSGGAEGAEEGEERARVYRLHRDQQRVSFPERLDL